MDNQGQLVETKGNIDLPCKVINISTTVAKIENFGRKHPRCKYVSPKTGFQCEGGTRNKDYCHKHTPEAMERQREYNRQYFKDNYISRKYAPGGSF